MSRLEAEYCLAIPLVTSNASPWFSHLVPDILLRSVDFNGNIVWYALMGCSKTKLYCTTQKACL